MILLLPPSETKRDGGREGTRLELEKLSFLALTPQREAALRALVELSRDDERARAALKLGPTQNAELRRNRTVLTSGLVPALDRYTGVLFDALAPAELEPQARTFAEHHLVIHSALLGLVRGGDGIPAYRLSHDSRLPGQSLRQRWRSAISGTLEGESGLVLDLRSGSYAELGPVGGSAWTLRVVSEQPGGRRIAVSHFNKAAKGRFVRALVQAGVVHDTVVGLLDWARQHGLRLEATHGRTLELVI